MFVSGVVLPKPTKKKNSATRYSFRYLPFFSTFDNKSIAGNINIKLDTPNMESHLSKLSEVMKGFLDQCIISSLGMRELLEALHNEE